MVQHIKGPDVSVVRAADAHEVGLTHGHDHYGTDDHGAGGTATQLSHGSGEERAVCADDLHNWVKPSGAADTEGHVSCHLALVLVPHLPQQFSGRSSNGGKVLRIEKQGEQAWSSLQWVEVTAYPLTVAKLVGETSPASTEAPSLLPTKLPTPAYLEVYSNALA